jgi:hypothetical protein
MVAGDLQLFNMPKTCETLPISQVAPGGDMYENTVTNSIFDIFTDTVWVSPQYHLIAHPFKI